MKDSNEYHLKKKWISESNSLETLLTRLESIGVIKILTIFLCEGSVSRLNGLHTATKHGLKTFKKFRWEIGVWLTLVWVKDGAEFLKMIKELTINLY